MTADEVQTNIGAIVNRLLAQRGLEPVSLASATRFLSGEMPMDSLDLAVLVTELEQVTKKDPFKDGFKNFQTVGELAQLYAG